MKKKRIITIIASAVMAVSFAVLGTGCSLGTLADRFLCEHQWDNGVVVKESTCADFGKTEYTCLECGDVKIENIERLPHSEKEISPKLATCTEDGYNKHLVCAECGEILSEYKTEKAFGHKYEEVVGSGYAATCTLDGLTAQVVCVNDGCGKELGKQERIPATGHKIVTYPGYKSTCQDTGLTDGQFCDYCDEWLLEREVIPVAPHVGNYGEECENCGVEIYEAISFREGSKVLDGDIIAGKWIRIYRGTTNTEYYDPDDEYLRVGSESIGFSICIDVERPFTGRYPLFMNGVRLDEYFECYYSEDGTYIDLKFEVGDGFPYGDVPLSITDDWALQGIFLSHPELSPDYEQLRVYYLEP